MTCPYRVYDLPAWNAYKKHKKNITRASGKSFIKFPRNQYVTLFQQKFAPDGSVYLGNKGNLYQGMELQRRGSSAIDHATTYDRALFLRRCHMSEGEYISSSIKPPRRHFTNSREF